MLRDKADDSDKSAEANTACTCIQEESRAFLVRKSRAFDICVLSRGCQQQRNPRNNDLRSVQGRSNRFRHEVPQPT